MDKRVKKAIQRKSEVKPEPTWFEVWLKIYNCKNSANDLKRLDEVKQAIEDGEISKEVDSLKKFSKAHALRLHTKVLQVRKESYIQKLIENTPNNYICVYTVDKFKELLELLEGEKLIALDTETTGLTENDVIVGMSMSLPDCAKHFYIPLRHKNITQLNAIYVFSQIKPFLEDKHLKKVLHNAKFDSHMLRRDPLAHIDLNGIVMDTMVAFHALSENEPSYALKNLATKYGSNFGFEDESYTFKELFGNETFDNVNLELATYYACKDTHLTLNLANWINKFLIQNPDLNRVVNTEMQVLPVVIEMERNGFNIDKEFARKYRNELKVNQSTLLGEIDYYLGGVNIDSPKQLLEFFKSKDILPQKAKSVDKKVLKILAESSPSELGRKVSKLILDYRDVTKLLSTYIEPLPHLLSADGRLRGSFLQSSTVTGRFSSRNPNLQNLPYEARQMFIPSKGNILVSIDFSKIEPLLLADISGDKEFKKPFIEGKDLYSELASTVFRVPVEECGDGSKLRKMMKVGLLGTMYGMSSYSLSKSLNIELEDAISFTKNFLETYTGVKTFIEKTHRFVKDFGYVRILGGRKRRFPNIKYLTEEHYKLYSRYKIEVGSNLYDLAIPFKIKDRIYNIDKCYHTILRQSVNALIQGAGAYSMKLAMINVYPYCIDHGIKILATVHDELIFECSSTVDRGVILKLGEIMKDSVPVSLPVTVDIAYTDTNWSNLKPF